MPFKDPTKTFSTRIPEDLLFEIERYAQSIGIDRNTFVLEAIEEKLENESQDKLEKEIRELQNKLETLQGKKDNFQTKAAHRSNLPEREITFLVQTKRILEERPEFLKGRIQLYKNTFGKVGERIGSSEFMNLLIEAEKQQRERKDETKQDTR